MARIAAHLAVHGLPLSSPENAGGGGRRDRVEHGPNLSLVARHFG
jgi:hypothetical protein